ncbi:hypothetical protein M407DRAFT_27210 [Tulasnella calospora MUT 4182]|uniref:Uncharacterized protein n=1 Tax=Tulasnella calospora MUT 4182 TaxID=1051891 RepID=A0A0C3Q3J3_9AGAM|nr:hypothetical protein M407DRAFT_27210 [Tulasnella calospora MUT 4182]
MRALCPRTPTSLTAPFLRRYTTGEARRSARSCPSVEHAPNALTDRPPVSQKVSLARLPKTKANKFQSLHFRNATPGSSAKLVSDSFQLHRPSAQKPHPNAEWYTDPTHPIHTCTFKDVPKYESDFFKIRAYPFARLAPHSSGVPNPYMEEMIKKRRKGQMPMSLIVPMSPYSLHKSGAIRKVVRSRLKEALRLVVVRGARGSDNCEASSAILDESDAAPDKWVMKGQQRLVSSSVRYHADLLPSSASPV